MPSNSPTFPQTGYVRLPQLIGRREVTPEEASENKARARAVTEAHPGSKPNATDKDRRDLARQLAKIGPRTPQSAVVGVLPFSKSLLWMMVKGGRFPAPVKFGKITAWRVEDVRTFIEGAAV